LQKFIKNIHEPLPHMKHEKPP